MAAFGTVDVETIRMILPTADSGIFLSKHIATAPTTIITPTKTPPRKEPLKKVHFNPSLYRPVEKLWLW
jgi:hypothetical protein